MLCLDLIVPGRIDGKMYNDQRKVGFPYQQKDSRSEDRRKNPGEPSCPGRSSGRAPVGGGGGAAEREKVRGSAAMGAGNWRRRIWECSFFDASGSKILLYGTDAKLY
jgi:hypothetical protein